MLCFLVLNVDSTQNVKRARWAWRGVTGPCSAHPPPKVTPLHLDAAEKRLLLGRRVPGMRHTWPRGGRCFVHGAPPGGPKGDQLSPHSVLGVAWASPGFLEAVTCV